MRQENYDPPWLQLIILFQRELVNIKWFFEYVIVCFDKITI